MQGPIEEWSLNMIGNIGFWTKNKISWTFGGPATNKVDSYCLEVNNQKSQI
jgi:hypothetical protein